MKRMKKVKRLLMIDTIVVGMKRKWIEDAWGRLLQIFDFFLHSYRRTRRIFLRGTEIDRLIVGSRALIRVIILVRRSSKSRATGLVVVEHLETGEIWPKDLRDRLAYPIG